MISSAHLVTCCYKPVRDCNRTANLNPWVFKTVPSSGPEGTVGRFFPECVVLVLRLARTLSLTRTDTHNVSRSNAMNHEV